MVCIYHFNMFLRVPLTKHLYFTLTHLVLPHLPQVLPQIYNFTTSLNVCSWTPPIYPDYHILPLLPPFIQTLANLPRVIRFTALNRLLPSNRTLVYDI